MGVRDGGLETGSCCFGRGVLCEDYAEEGVLAASFDGGDCEACGAGGAAVEEVG